MKKYTMSGKYTEKSPYFLILTFRSYQLINHYELDQNMEPINSTAWQWRTYLVPSHLPDKSIHRFERLFESSIHFSKDFHHVLVLQ